MTTALIGREQWIPNTSERVTGGWKRPRRAKLAVVMECRRRSCGDASAQIKNRHAHRQTVSHLIENNAVSAVGHFAVNLDSAVDWTGMHDEAIRFEHFSAFFR